MKYLKRVVSTLLIGVLILMQLPTENVLAAHTALDAGTYAEIMSSMYAGYFIKSQPNNAVVLKEEILLEDNDKYSAMGYWFLPRLNYQYYYSMEENEFFDYSPQLNAIRILKDAEETDVVQLTISSVATGRELEQFEFHLDAPYTVTQPVESPKVSTNIQTFTCKSTYYNPDVVFAGGFIMPDYIGIPADNLSADVVINATLFWDGDKVDEVNPSGIVDLAQYESTLETVELTYDKRQSVQNSMSVSKLASYYLRSDNTDILPLFACEPSYDGFCYQPLDPGSTTSKTSFTFICNAALITLEYDPDADIGFQYRYDVEPGNSVDLAENASSCMSILDTPANTPSGTSYSNGTLYVSTGFIGDVATSGKSFAGFEITKITKVSSDWPANSYKIIFSESEDYSYSYIVVTCGVSVMLPTPVKENYTFEGWFTDSQCTTPFNDAGYPAGTTVTVYPKWQYTGGHYTVKFYDGYNNTTDTQSFQISEQPTLPTNPTYTGYTFKYWTIVNALSDTNGKIYDPSTFKPKADGTYIFKAVFSVSGVIKEVVNSQASYYIGQSIDKSKLTVVVITDDNGTTRNLGTDEYDISPTNVTSEGTTTITVKYKATGATATFKVSGSKDPLALLTVKYSGGDLAKGETIPTSQITVYGSYGSGKTEQLSGWTISPTTITKVGTNNIKVTYANLSANLVINGVDSTTDKSVKEVASITASYAGPTLTVGDKIAPANIKVTATYKDGTTARLESTAFSFSPDVVRAAGANTIIVNYDGFSATCTVDAQEKSGSTNSTQPTGSNNSSGGQTGGSYGDQLQNTALSDSLTNYNKSGKGVSPYYIKGHTILNVSAMSGNTEHSVDINSILTEAEENSAVTVNLYNGDPSNILNSTGFNLLHEKSLVLYVNMLNEYTLQSIAYWTVNGKLTDSITESISFNVNTTEVNKAYETMYAISVEGSSYPVGTTVVVELPGAFPIGTYTRLYATDAELNNSTFLQDALWGDADALSLPLSNCPYYVITDRLSLYPDGSDVCAEIIDDDASETEETIDEIEEEPASSEVADKPFTPARHDTTKQNLTKILGIASVVLIAAAAVAGLTAICKVLKRSKRNRKR